MKHTLVFHTIDVGRRIQKLIDFRAEPISLSYSEASALLILDYHKELSQKTISLMLNLEPASVVTLVDELEKSKLVKRQSVDDDRRKYQIALTAQGLDKVRLIKDRSYKLDNFLVKKLTPAKTDNFLKTLNRLSLHLDEWKGGENENFSSK